LAHSDSRAATLLNAITCPHPGPQGIVPYSDPQ
jgi:hypothetical protein